MEKRMEYPVEAAEVEIQARRAEEALRKARERWEETEGRLRVEAEAKRRMAEWAWSQVLGP
jgi:hypothetical protein